MQELKDMGDKGNVQAKDSEKGIREKLVSSVGSEEEPKGIFNTIVRPCVVECFGLVIFVYIGAMSISGKGGIVGAALAHGFTIFLLVAALGHISGGHYNPAVTLGLALSGGVKPVLAVLYVVSQCIGSLIGAACVKGSLMSGEYYNISGGSNMLGANYTPGNGFLCETLTTCVLVTVVLNAALDTKGQNVLAPLAIGITVGVDILATGHVSGASMNPARSFGPAVIAGIDDPRVWSYHYLNWVGPLCGALLATALYRFIFAAPDRRINRETFKRS